MRKVVLIALSFLLASTAFAQKPAPVKKPAAVKTNLAKPAPTPKDPEIEKADFQKAVDTVDPTAKIKALQKFNRDNPKSENRLRALELIVTARAVLADEKLQARDWEAGVKLFKLALEEAPDPIPDALFEGVVANFPANLFWQGQRDAAVEIAKSIETRAGTNTKQLLAMAGFYLGVENAAEAKRIAEKVLQIEPASKSAYQTLGLAHRMSFEPEEAAAAYGKALELDSASVVSRRSLAETKRALGKSDEAAALYREILAADPDDAAARTGLILSLFDAENRTEAEREMASSLEKEANNLPLLAGAAYWYAAHNNGAKAIELAQKAINIEPRYVWSHIALARGQMLLGHPLEAERILLSARQYGNFPTLEYEIASARIMAGFYRDAADELRKSFGTRDGVIAAYLGGRILKESKTFTELIAYERRASIFQPLAADNPENAGKLKALLDFTLKLDAPESNEADLIAAADEFISGDDNMKFHRQMYAANALLGKKIAISKVLDIMNAATGNSDRALDVPSAASAVLADQLYDSRALAMSKGELVVVPNVSRVTLSTILRGRIEHTAGVALLRQGNAAEAVVRFRRALSVFPDKSAWWRATMWNMGEAHAAEGRDKDALDSYIKSYVTDKPDGAKYAVIETLYRKINGNTDGLEARIGANPSPPVATAADKPAESPAQKIDAVEAKSEPSPKIKTENKPGENPGQKVEEKQESKPADAPVEKPADTPAETKPAGADIAKPSDKVPEKAGPGTAGSPDAAKTEPEKSNPAPAGDDQPKPSDTGKTAESKPDAPQTDAKTGDQGKPSEPAKEKPKDLFEPIIITIPKPSADKPSGENSGAARPRVVGEAEKIEPAKCSLTFSQENVSLLSDGGSIGVLVGLEGEGDITEVTARSSSPRDVSVTADPEVGGPRKAFFVIKSINTSIGNFRIAFTSPCGEREITVKVH